MGWLGVVSNQVALRKRCSLKGACCSAVRYSWIEERLILLFRDVMFVYKSLHSARTLNLQDSLQHIYGGEKNGCLDKAESSNVNVNVAAAAGA